MSKAKSKTQKKIDNNIRLALTSACQSMLEEVPGFQWLTHQADYTNFPASLLIICVFDSLDHQLQAESGGKVSEMKRVIQAKLLKAGVKFKSLEQQILLDNEQACEQEHQGNWTLRLTGYKGRAIGKNRPG